MNEVWVFIKDTDNQYLISDHGNVFSVRRNKVLKHGKSPYGYHVASIRTNTDKFRNRKKFIHRLVASHFIPNVHNKPHINHIDSSKVNNHFLNLEWCTSKENINHCIGVGRFRLITKENALRGEDNGMSVLSKEKVLKIRELYKNGVFGTEIANIFNIGNTTVYNIVNRNTWKHV